MANLLLVSILFPLIGAIVIGVSMSASFQRVRAIALAVSVTTLACACVVVIGFDPSQPGTYALTEHRWLPESTGVDLRFSIGLDGLGLWLYALSAVLMFTSILVSWEAIKERPALYYSMLMLLESGCLGVFAARDLLLFYVFFEFTLMPLFFLIGIWGSEERQHAAQKFFIFTLAGSLLTFVGLLSIVLYVYASRDSAGPFMTFSIPALADAVRAHPMPASMQNWIFAALFAGFAIKVPLFPLHTWLPLAHVQAPTAGSVFLAGILLKIGTYGFLRFSIPMLPDATLAWAPVLLWLSVIGIVYGALVALAQSDMKRLIAYSSVSHLGFCMLGLFALNSLSVHGATLQMINHGVSTGALFALVGMLYERYHTREIVQYGGLARRLPVLAFFMLLFTLSSIGLPGLNGFAGEILILTGMFQHAWTGLVPGFAEKIISVIAVSGVVLGAWYMLWLVQRVFFGPLREPSHADPDEIHTVQDLSGREVAALLPLAVLVFWIGVYPKFFLDRMTPALRQAISSVSSHSDSQVAASTFVTPRDESRDN
jgi:NADH-quinone oxidoreductase subunit M